MRGKLMLWGAAVAIVLSSTAAIASVVVVKSLGPSSKAYPPGKTLSDSATITLQGGECADPAWPRQLCRRTGRDECGFHDLARSVRRPSCIGGRA